MQHAEPAQAAGLADVRLARVTKRFAEVTAVDDLTLEILMLANVLASGAASEPTTRPGDGAPCGYGRYRWCE